MLVVVFNQVPTNRLLNSMFWTMLISVIYSRLGAAGSRLRLLSSQTSGCTMRRQEHNGKYKAVIFDMGGVLVPGPGAVFRGKLNHIDIKFVNHVPSRILSVTGASPACFVPRLVMHSL